MPQKTPVSKTKNVQPLQEDKPAFQIEQPTIPGLPDFRDPKTVNVRYPLIPPYTFARISWDSAESELTYTIEEPILTDKEKDTLKILEDGVKELINLSYISVNDKNTILIYLEKNIRVLLTELSIDLPMDSFLKIMYYIYRDFVGLNELEPLMNDYFIEDVECNGLNTPVYVVHRKYRNIRTNLVYTDLHKMAAFVEKLAQKCGRYVSYAEPLLDGSLPDGSRINATYTTDVSSKGPTFTARKFTKEPWSPVQLIQKGTVTAEIFAYLWMAVEYENSLMVIGGTGSGKCVTGDTPIYLSNGQKEKIKDLVESKFKQGKITKNGNWEFVEDKIEILSMDPENLKIIKTKTDKLWRHKAPHLLIKLNTNQHRDLTCTPEHPFFINNGFNITKKRADELIIGDEVAYPENIHIDSKILFDKIEFIDYILDHDEEYVYDLTVPHTHNFLAGNYPLIAHNTSFINGVAFFIPPQARVVSIEDTRELQLEHENWLPSVARAGVGLTNLVGQRYGEVSLFDLLRASFRQRPDYIIVGEVRGKEAFVLFQAFASIRGDEEIFVIKDNKPFRIKIKDLENENITKLKAISYNIKERKCEILPIKGWIKHSKRNTLYKINTRTGREITVTPDHSLFTFEDNEVREIKGEDLVIGSKLIIPSYIQSGYNNIEKINLLEYLPDLRIYAPSLVEEASHKLGYYQASALVNCKSVTDYYSETEITKPNAIKAEKFIKLMNEAEIEYKTEDLEVKFNGMSEKCSAYLYVSDELLKLLGYYLSEGSLNIWKRNYKIELYNKNKEVLRDMKKCIIRVSGKTPDIRITDRGWGEATELSFNHKVLYEFIKRYCKRKFEKRIPNFIYGLDKRKIGIFLSALYTGDGCLNDDSINYYTTSKNLANDVAQLLLAFGIVATINKRSRIGRKTTDYEINFYASYKREEFLKYVKPIGKTSKIVKGLEDRNLIGELYCDEIKSIEVLQMSEPEYVYDISVPGNQNFIGGFGSVLLHNSGHPGMATMHAENITTLIKRLETEPINLSSSLIETLAAVVVMSQTRVKGKEVRKVSSIDEIIQVRDDGTEVTNAVFKWDPRTDTVVFNSNSKVFENIASHYGMTKEQVMNEFNLRVKLLKELQKRGIIGFKEVQKIVHEYYKQPQEVLKRFKLI